MRLGKTASAVVTDAEGEEEAGEGQGYTARMESSWQPALAAINVKGANDQIRPNGARCASPPAAPSTASSAQLRCSQAGRPLPPSFVPCARSAPPRQSNIVSIRDPRRHFQVGMASRACIFGLSLDRPCCSDSALLGTRLFPDMSPLAFIRAHQALLSARHPSCYYFPCRAPCV